MAGDPLVDGIIAGRLAALQGRGNYQLGHNVVNGVFIIAYKAIAFCLALFLCAIAPLAGLFSYGPFHLISYILSTIVGPLTVLDQRDTSTLVFLSVLFIFALMFVNFMILILKLPAIILHFVRLESKLVRTQSLSQAARISIVVPYAILNFLAAAAISLYFLLGFFPPYSPVSASSIQSLEQFYELIQVHVWPEYGWAGLFDPTLMGSATLNGVAFCITMGLISFGRTFWLIRKP